MPNTGDIKQFGKVSYTTQDPTTIQKSESIKPYCCPTSLTCNCITLAHKRVLMLFREIRHSTLSSEKTDRDPDAQHKLTLYSVSSLELISSTFQDSV